MYTIKISLSPSYFQDIPIWAVAAKLWLVDDWFRDYMNQYFMGIWESRSQPTSAKERHRVGFRTLLNHGKLNHKMASQNWVQTFGIRWWTWKSFGSMYDLTDRFHCVSQQWGENLLVSSTVPHLKNPPYNLLDGLACGFEYDFIWVDVFLSWFHCGKFGMVDGVSVCWLCI